MLLFYSDSVIFCDKLVRISGGKSVAALVIAVTVMTLYPYERYNVTLVFGNEQAPEVVVKGFLPIGLAPSALHPGINPALAYGIENVF